MSRNPRALLRSAGALRLAAQGREQGISFSFAGAKAVTADKHLHAVAQGRLAAGEDEDLVRRDAAWFRGPDGQMRFEISDDGAKFKERIFWEGRWFPARFLERAHDRGGDGASELLGNVLDHPALFSAYPFLAELKVQLRIRDSGEIGSVLSDRIDAEAPTDDALLSVLMHEVQHVIQFFENFAIGGNCDFARMVAYRRLQERVNEVNEKVLTLCALRSAIGKSDVDQYEENVSHHRQLVCERAELQTAQKSLRMDQHPAYLAYQRLAGEVEARNVQARLKMTPEERVSTPPNATSDTDPEKILVVFLPEAQSLLAENASRERMR
jgi:hypothetical protein